MKNGMAILLALQAGCYFAETPVDDPVAYEVAITRYTYSESCDATFWRHTVSIDGVEAYQSEVAESIPGDTCDVRWVDEWVTVGNDESYEAVLQLGDRTIMLVGLSWAEGDFEVAGETGTAYLSARPVQ